MDETSFSMTQPQSNDSAEQGASPFQADSAAKRPTKRSVAANPPLRSILRTIEAEIIPRLVLAHTDGLAMAPAAGAPTPRITTSDITEFSALVRTHDAQAVRLHVRALLSKGVSMDTLYLQLLAPTARFLGELWEVDRCDFTEVTLGLWRIQQVMFDLSPDFGRSSHSVGSKTGTILLAPVPGSQHTFGSSMLSEFFRRAGWDVCADCPQSLDALKAAVSSRFYDVVGLSISTNAQVAQAPTVITALRRASRNRSIGVMVGGPLVMDQADFAANVGADSSAADAHQAVLQAETLVARRLAQEAG